MDTHPIEDMVLGELSALLRTLPARLTRSMQAEVIRICNEVEAQRKAAGRAVPFTGFPWAYKELRRRLGVPEGAEQ